MDHQSHLGMHLYQNRLLVYHFDSKEIHLYEEYQHISHLDLPKDYYQKIFFHSFILCSGHNKSIYRINCVLVEKAFLWFRQYVLAQH